MKRCINCKYFESIPFTFNQQGDCTKHEKIIDNSTGNFCKHWQEMKPRNSETLNILKATLECYERQYEYSCHLGDARCVKCDFNIRQGTIGEHMEALKEAIRAIEGGTKE